MIALNGIVVGPVIYFMASKTFVNITREECKHYFPKIVANSQRKWNAAALIAEKGDFGTAVSLATISVEELVKALLLAFDSLGFSFRKIRGVDTVFKNHKIRYFISYLMFLMGVVGEDFKELIIRIVKEPGKFEQDFTKIKDDDQAMAEWLGPYVIRKINQIHEELLWFSALDIFRQKGFYSDLSDSFIDPIDITKEDYSELAERFQKIRIACLFLIEYANNQNENSEMIDNVRRTFIRINAYNNIAKLLKILREDDTKDPFRLLQLNIVPKLNEIVKNGFATTLAK